MEDIIKTGKGKTALITGASGGIGYEIAMLFARNGYNLVLIARSEDKLGKISAELEEKYIITCNVIAADLSIPSAPAEIFKITEEEGLKIDVLVNNAGFATYGPFIESKLNSELEMLQVNIAAVTQLSYLYGKSMAKNGGGKILNVASTAAFQPGPLMAVYYASKAYVLHFSEAISNELNASNVTVSVLCPGPTKTDFQDRAKMQKSRLFKLSKVMDASSVALCGYKGLMQGKTIIIPGIQNKILARSIRLFPRKAVTFMARKIQELQN
ncbi:MAG: SDR family oxidoreductase [Ignavibacteriaceae bacterium]|nr:SDR family oxidoreductase [Ignavibacteriaceae bacterium]